MEQKEINITANKRKLIEAAILDGKSVKDIAFIFYLEEDFVRAAYKEIIMKILFDKPRRIGRKCEICFGSKTIPYYENEDDYLKIPQYNWDDLTYKEIYFYKLQEKKQKMEKLKRYKIDVLLHLNATLMANLGTDSTKEEIKWVKQLQRDNYKKIKEIDLDFYKAIDDGENKAKNYY